jgi:hypothetical protein
VGDQTKGLDKKERGNTGFALSRIFGFTVDFRAPSISAFFAEWVGYLQNPGLHNPRKSTRRAGAFIDPAHKY